MKIRIGFVSNSSSSSFVINRQSSDSFQEFDSVRDVAIAMIPKREWGAKDRQLIKKIEKALQSGKINKDTPISFRSCNYDTYIVKWLNQFLISTCNNHDWDLEESVYLDIPESFKKQTHATEVGDIEYLFDFYYPEFDIVGRAPNRYHAKLPNYKPYKMDIPWHCEECHNELVLLAKEKIIACPKCYKKRAKDEN